MSYLAAASADEDHDEIKALRKKLKRVKQQRNDLRDAIRTILAIKFSNWSDGEMRNIARVALEKTK